MVKIKKQLVPNWVVRNYTYGGKNGKKYIVIHETANTQVGANAQAHANLQSKGNARKASWHWQVDDIHAIQSFSDDAQAWHAGNAYYNRNGIGIEIAVNRDGNFNKTIDNTVGLVQMLMKKYNIPITRVVRHKDTSGKYCPANLMSGSKGITWAQFKNRLKGKTISVSVNRSVNEVAKEVIAGKWGNDPSRSNKLRNAGYNPSVVQSEVNRILTGKAVAKSKKSTNTIAKEVIDGKWGNNPRRSQDLRRAGYNPDTVQKEVNRLLSNRNITKVAKEVIAGKWGNGQTRINRLRRAGHDPNTVQKEVNRLLK